MYYLYWSLEEIFLLSYQERVVRVGEVSVINCKIFDLER